MEEGEAFTYEEMEEIEYSVKISGISLLGEESSFAEARFPLKTSVAGIFYDSGNRRLLMFLKTLDIDEDCPFIAPSLSVEKKGRDTFLPKSSLSPKGAWDWSGPESCFHERVSIIAITGFGSVTPF